MNSFRYGKKEATQTEQFDVELEYKNTGLTSSTPGLLSSLIFLSGPPPIKAVPKTDGSIAKFNIPW